MNITSTIPKQDLQKINSIAHRSDSTALNYSAADIAELQLIAAQCPYEYGFSVYIARALLSPVDTTNYHNTCEMLIEDNNRSVIQTPASEESEKLIISVYPNPATDEISILVEASDIEGSYNYQIFDLEGRELSIIRQGTYNSTENFDVSSLTRAFIFSILQTIKEILITKEFQLSDKTYIRQDATSCRFFLSF